MEIDIDDLLSDEVEERKGRYHTIALTDQDRVMIDEARLVFGKKKVAEIIRRSARAGISQALERKKNKTA